MKKEDFKPVTVTFDCEYTYSIFQEALKREEKRLVLELAKITFKIHALETGDISDLPPSIVAEWTKMGFIINGKLVDENEPIKLLAENN